MSKDKLDGFGNQEPTSRFIEPDETPTRTDISDETKGSTLEIAHQAIVSAACEYIYSMVNKDYFDRYLERITNLARTTPDKVLLQICGIDQDLELTYGLTDVLKDFEEFKSNYELFLEQNPLDAENPTHIAVGLRDGNFLETYIQLTE
jgi:hypothetical protein